MLKLAHFEQQFVSLHILSLYPWSFLYQYWLLVIFYQRYVPRPFLNAWNKVHPTTYGGNAVGVRCISGCSYFPLIQGVPKKVFVYKKVDQYINEHFFWDTWYNTVKNKQSKKIWINPQKIHVCLPCSRLLSGHSKLQIESGPTWKYL